MGHEVNQMRTPYGAWRNAARVWPYARKIRLPLEFDENPQKVGQWALILPSRKI
jgi:hypothetical protein